MDSKNIYAECERFLTHHPSISMKETLQRLTNYAPDEKSDVYGNGEYLNSFEDEISSLFGKEKTLFFISGTMAQQIAMRIWCERKKNFNIVIHPKSHLAWAEHDAYLHIHGITRIQFGAPELMDYLVPTLSNYKRIASKFSAIIIELPQRNIAKLPSWEELEEISKWCKQQNIALHMDGARIWESQYYYGKSLKEIASLFDSIYISFYKGLNNLTGAALIGLSDFIEEAKIWQRRMGGNLRTQFPFVVSAKKALDENLSKMDTYNILARKISEYIHSLEMFTVSPYPIHTNMFQVVISKPFEEINKIHLKYAEETKNWLFTTRQAFADTMSQTEITIGDNAVNLGYEWITNELKKFHDGLI